MTPVAIQPAPQATLTAITANAADRSRHATTATTVGRTTIAMAPELTTATMRYWPPENAKRNVVTRVMNPAEAAMVTAINRTQMAGGVRLTIGRAVM